jgi:hypothetical protein
MVAYAMQLLRTTKAREVLVHPDGEHGKRFDFAGWLAKRGFERTSRTGKTNYAGLYVLPDGRSAVINPVSGKGDVVTDVGGAVISAECKGGIINTRHSGQLSRLYKGLCETVGLADGRSLAGPAGRGRTPDRRHHRLALRLAPRCAAGIEIALVGSRGEIFDVRGPEPENSSAAAGSPTLLGILRLPGPPRRQSPACATRPTIPPVATAATVETPEAAAGIGEASRTSHSTTRRRLSGGPRTTAGPSKATSIRTRTVPSAAARSSSTGVPTMDACSSIGWRGLGRNITAPTIVASRNAPRNRRSRRIRRRIRSGWKTAGAPCSRRA